MPLALILGGLKAVFLDVRVLLLIALAVCGARCSHLAKDRDGWKASTHAWSLAFAAEQGAFRTDAALRAEEGRQAAAAVDAVESMCDARVAAVRARQAAIAALTSKEPTYAPAPPSGVCPVRELVPDRELHDALFPPAR